MEYTLFCLKIEGWRGKKHFDVHLWRIRSVNFLLKDGDDATHEGRGGRERCLFPARVGNSASIFINESTFPYLYLELARDQLCFPPRKRCKKENWKYKNTTNICTNAVEQLLCLPKTTLLHFANFYKRILFSSVLKHCCSFVPSSILATLRNKRKLAAINRDNHEDHLRNK